RGGAKRRPRQEPSRFQFLDPGPRPAATEERSGRQERVIEGKRPLHPIPQPPPATFQPVLQAKFALSARTPAARAGAAGVGPRHDAPLVQYSGCLIEERKTHPPRIGFGFGGSVKRRSCRPVATSQSLSVCPPPPVTTHFPEAEKAMDF